MAAAGLSLEQAAALLGCTERYIRQLRKDGQLVVDTTNKLAAIPFGRWLRDRITSELGVTATGEAYDFQAERARLTFHQANIASVDEEIKKRNVIPAELVRQHWEQMLVQFRSKCLTLPSRLASSCAGASAIEVERMARELVNEALAELAGDGAP